MDGGFDVPWFTATADVQREVNGKIVRKGGQIELSARMGAWLIHKGYPLQAPPGFVGPVFKQQSPQRRCCGG